MADRTRKLAAGLGCAALVSAGCGGQAADRAVVISDADAQAGDAAGAGMPENDASTPCPAGTTLCSGHCVQTDFDPENCGACGNGCPAGTVCSAGACGLVCLGGSTQCGALCVDVRDDPSNCGGCGARCAAGIACVNGACASLGGTVPSNDAGPSDGGPIDAGSIDAGPVDAGLECATGSMNCAGACVGVTSDPNNCGGCARSCGEFQTCSDGQCICASTASSCNSVCLNTAIDMANCGDCGVTCSAGNVCTGGSCSAPAADWPTLGHDPQHTGENGDETGTPPMVNSWKAVLVPGGNALSSPVVQGGRVFVTYQTYFGSNVPLMAVNVADGSPAWTYNFGALSSIGFPTASGGAVYVQTIDQRERGFLWSLDAAVGSINWGASFPTQWAAFWAPTVQGSTVFVDAGEFGGLYAFATADGSPVFADTAIGQYDSWSPAYFDGEVYTFVAGVFQATDPTTGVAAWSTSTTWNGVGSSMRASPVFGSALAYVITPPNLVAIDPVQQVVAWTANATYAGTPAVTGNLVLGISAGNLVARDATTGKLEWTFVGDKNLSYPPVIAAGYAYVASTANVYAVRLADHTQAWTASVGGWLAIANDRLLVAATNGTLYGYVLTR